MSKPVIMAIDDQAAYLHIIRHSMGNEFDFRVFKSGKEAVHFLRAGNAVDMVILDYEMPSMSGDEVLVAIRANESTRNLPVVFLTGETSEKNKSEMLDLGASDYLCKPISNETLGNCIRKWLPNK